MSVILLTADGAESQFRDSQDDRYAYKVTETGGLVVVHKSASQDDKWYARWEYSPAGWHQVEGTRYPGPLERLAGADGVVRRDSATPTATVL